MFNFFKRFTFCLRNLCVREDEGNYQREDEDEERRAQAELVEDNGEGRADASVHYL